MQLANTLNLDANTTAYFERELQHLKAREIKVKKGDLRFLDIFPVATDTPEYATSVTYRTYDARGVAKIITSYGDDLPMVDVDAKETVTAIKTIGLAYSYSVDEVRQGAIQGTPLSQRRANQAMRGTMETHNRIFWQGDADAGLIGLLSDPNITSGAVANGASGNSEWSTKTPDEILNDLTSGYINIVELTKGIERPDVLIMSPSSLQKIMTTRMASDTRDTVLDAFKLMYPDVQVTDAQELAGAFAGSTDGFIFGKTSPEYIEAEAPIVYESLPPQANNLGFKVPTNAKNGGVKVYYPLAFSKLRGI